MISFPPLPTNDTRSAFCEAERSVDRLVHRRAGHVQDDRVDRTPGWSRRTSAGLMVVKLKAATSAAGRRQDAAVLDRRPADDADVERLGRQELAAFQDLKAFEPRLPPPAVGWPARAAQALFLLRTTHTDD